MNKQWMIFACAMALTGCGTQVDDDYRGDPGGVVQGKLSLEDGVANPGDLQVALLWVNSVGSNDRSYGQRVDVQGEFPANFELTLIEPPPSEYLNDLTRGGILPEERRIGIAYIIAVPKSVDLNSQEELPKDTAWGASERFVVAYVEQDIEPGTFSETLVGGPLKKGFHLLHSTPSTATEADSDAYYEECEFETPECDDEFDAAYEAEESGASEAEKQATKEAYKECSVRSSYDAAKAAGCLDRANPTFDALDPAEGGFDAEIDITIGTGTPEIPELDVNNAGLVRSVSQE